jgi:hypothetical protein
MPLLHVLMFVQHLQGACSHLSYFKIIFKLICIKHLCIQSLWTLKQFLMQVVSWLVLNINFILMFGLCSSGSIYIRKNINIKNKITVHIGMLQNIGITILWWTHLYSCVARVTVRLRLSVYWSVWLCHLKRIRGWVQTWFVQKVSGLEL